MKHFIWHIVLLCLTVFLPSGARADDADCPTRLAAVEHSELAAEVAKRLLVLHDQLGCAVEIVYLPPNRGVIYFNDGKVDGEILRFPVIEKHYSKRFVRTSVPLFNSVNALWFYPDKAISEKRSIGYVYGLAWHMDAVKKLAHEYDFAKFHSQSKMYQAYNQGKLGGFLLGSPLVKLALQNRTIKSKPVLNRVISDSSFYYYADYKYKKFVAKLSDQIKRTGAFNDLNY